MTSGSRPARSRGRRAKVRAKTEQQREPRGGGSARDDRSSERGEASASSIRTSGSRGRVGDGMLTDIPETRPTEAGSAQDRRSSQVPSRLAPGRGPLGVDAGAREFWHVTGVVEAPTPSVDAPRRWIRGGRARRTVVSPVGMAQDHRAEQTPSGAPSSAFSPASPRNVPRMHAPRPASTARSRVVMTPKAASPSSRGPATVDTLTETLVGLVGRAVTVEYMSGDE